MNQREIQVKLLDILSSNGMPISADNVLLKNLDSLQAVSLLSLIENPFSIEVGIFDLTEANFGTLDALVGYIEKKRSTRETP